MREGTKKLFPKDYDVFTETMVCAAEEDELPVTLQLNELKDFTLKDLQDLFVDFYQDTSLELTGHLFYCASCNQLHMVMEVDWPEEEEDKMLQ